MNDKQAKEFLEDANTQKFLDAGITDINIIHNARTMMDDANKTSRFNDYRRGCCKSTTC